MKSKTIFVSIPSFNEEDLRNTILNARATARHPDRIYFGIFYHNTDDYFQEIDDIPNVNCLKTSSPNMLGIGMSRFMANQFYNYQDYYLQIDAHTIFDTWWDERLIEDLENIKKSGLSKKPVISFYLPDWVRNEDRSIALDTLKLWQEGLQWDHDNMENIYWDAPIMSTFKVDWANEPYQFKQHYGIAAQFIFADGSFCKEITPDYEIMFYGEEPTMALRAFSNGYKIFVTRKACMWHKNKLLSANPPKDRIRFKTNNPMANFIYESKLKHGLKKVKDILTGDLVGMWGADSNNKIAAYESASGINFKDFYINMKKLDNGRLWYESE